MVRINANISIKKTSKLLITVFRFLVPVKIIFNPFSSEAAKILPARNIVNNDKITDNPRRGKTRNSLVSHSSSKAISKKGICFNIVYTAWGEERKAVERKKDVNNKTGVAENRKPKAPADA